MICKQHPGVGEIHILLADDNPGDVFLVRRALDKHLSAYELSVLTDGADVLEFLKHIDQQPKERPEIVLLDLNLPRCHGSEILRRIRANPLWKDVPVIIVSSSDSSQDRAKAAALQADRYFRKPSDFASFLKLGEVVKEMLPQYPQDGATRLKPLAFRPGAGW